MKYEEFLELPEDKRYEYLTRRTKLNWFQRMHIKYLNKWWTYILRNANPDLRGVDVWESIYKGRF